jgi:hypothetical protein
MMFEMVGRLDECFLLSYAIDPGQATALVPAGLEPVTCHGVAFFNIVVCHVDRMRPRFAPRSLRKILVDDHDGHCAVSQTRSGECRHRVGVLGRGGDARLAEG